MRERIERLAGELKRRDPSFAFEVLTNLGSGGGVKALAKGAIQLAVVSRPLKPEESNPNLRVVEYARTPFVLVTAKPGVTALSAAQVAALYGRQARWPDGSPVRLVLRPAVDIDHALLAGLSPAMPAVLADALAREGMVVTATDREAADAVERLPGAIGVKLYPHQMDPYRRWHADDEVVTAVIERARALGLRTIAIHKALPNGSVPLDPYRVGTDLEVAADAFPDMNFEIIHSGMAFGWPGRLTVFAAGLALLAKLSALLIFAAMAAFLLASFSSSNLYLFACLYFFQLIVGISGGEFGVRCHLTAYDAKTGKQVWRAYSTGPGVFRNSPNATQATMSGPSAPKVTGGEPGTCAPVRVSMMRPNRIGSAKAAIASAILAADRSAPSASMKGVAAGRGTTTAAAPSE